eukprot:2180770-Rhodomonas_salina.2
MQDLEGRQRTWEQRLQYVPHNPPQPQMLTPVTTPSRRVPHTLDPEHSTLHLAPLSPHPRP